MVEKKHIMKFRKDNPEEAVPSPPETFDDKLDRIKEKNILSSNQASETPVNQTAPIRETLPKIERHVTEQGKPHDVSEEFKTIMQAYKGDLTKVEKFILENFEGEDLYYAGVQVGYQFCLTLVNDWFIRVNALKEIIENTRKGLLPVPFDPREDPVLITLIKQLSLVKVPKQISEQVPAKTPVQVPAKEDYSVRREKRLAELNAMIDEEPEAGP